MPSAFHDTRYGFRCNNWILLMAIETGWLPGNPVLFHLHICCIVACSVPSRGCREKVVIGQRSIHTPIRLVLPSITSICHTCTYLIDHPLNTRHTGHECCIRIESFFSTFLPRAIFFARLTALAVLVIVLVFIIRLFGFSFLRSRRRCRRIIVFWLIIVVKF